MTDINHKFFRKKLYKYTNKTFDIVSTIDHPYASPPIRLVDGHNKLKILNNQGLKPLICIWDVNFPNINNYRYELSFDTGILSIKNRDFFIFYEKFLYPLQQPKLIDFDELKKRMQLILERLHNLPKKSKIIRDKKFTENFNNITNIYIKTIKNSDNGTFFYENLIKNIYNFIGLSDLASLTSDFFYPYFASPIVREWIPYCIQETKNEPYGFLNLLNIELFKKPYFKSINYNNNEEALSNPVYIKKNINEILNLIKNQTLIPSYQIFFWTLFLANIKHFGNDYGFFEKLNKIITKHNFQFPEGIQLTEHNKDSQNIIQFEKDNSFNCFLENNNYVIKKNNPLKNSRISSLSALYCHLGEDLGKIVKNILEDKIKCPQIIKMGAIFMIYDKNKTKS